MTNTNDPDQTAPQGLHCCVSPIGPNTYGI